MKGIKNRGSQAHKVKTKYKRTQNEFMYERNMSEETDDDEPEPNDRHNKGRIT